LRKGAKGDEAIQSSVCRHREEPKATKRSSRYPQPWIASLTLAMTALVIARSASDEAIQSLLAALDCFAALAMTRRRRPGLLR
jgi:hypothetical protein